MATKKRPARKKPTKRKAAKKAKKVGKKKSTTHSGGPMYLPLGPQA